MHHWIRHISLAICFWTIQSCDQNSNIESEPPEQWIDIITYDFDYSPLDEETSDTLKFLEDIEEVVEGAIGPRATTPNIFYTQWNFIEAMSIAEAEHIYTHPNPNIRALSIKALYHHGDPNFGKKFIQTYSSKNIKEIQTHSGCRVWPISEFEYFQFTCPPFEEFRLDTNRFSVKDVLILDSLLSINDSLE